MCFRNAALGFLLNCCCTVLPLGLILACAFFFPWDANACTPKDAALCQGYTDAVSQIYTLGVITIVALLAAPVVGALVMHCCLKRNRTWVPNEVGGIVVYLIAVGTISACAYFFFTAGIPFPSDVLNGETQGKLCFLMAMFGIPICGLFACACLFIQRRRMSKARKAAMIPMTRPMREEEISDGEPKRGLDHDFLIGGPKREKTTPQHERPSSASLPPHAHPVRMQQPRPKPTYDEPVSPHSAPLPRFAGVPEGYYETTDAPDGPLVPQAIPRVFAPPDAGDQSALVFSPMYPPIPTVAEAEKSSEDLTRSSNSVLRKLSMRQKLQSMPPRADGVFAPPVASVGEALTEMKSKELASSAMERPHESEEVEMSESISESETDEFDEEATSSFEKAS